MKYEPKFLDKREIFSKQDRKRLKEIAIDFDKIRSNRRLLESQEFEFVYISAKTEGNTYTRGEAITLLEKGLTAGGKPFYDAKMLENLKVAFDQFVLFPKQITKKVIKDIHFVLNETILQKQSLGVFRDEAVSIKGSSYIPPVGREYISSEIDYILSNYEKFDDPFERSVYIHCNIAYLQPFKDGNKRTARVLQAVSLARDGIMPLVSKDKYIALYLDALLSYYESGSYKEYCNYFIKAYEEQQKYLINFKEC